jgi:putative chitinase
MNCVRILTSAEFLRVVPLARNKVGTVLPCLNSAMGEFEINTKMRQAHFLSQTAHESGSFVYVKELASGQAYEGRHDLGNTEPGDGVRFKGRGYIQITGRANYLQCSMELLGDDRLIQFPELLETPELAARSAAWWWAKHGLNELADAGAGSVYAITRRINGGTNGLAEREHFFGLANAELA